MSLQDITITDPPRAAFTAPVAAGIKQVTGSEISTAAVDTLSTEAFAPVAALWEDEMARVTCFGKGSALDLVGRFAGVSLSRVDCKTVRQGVISEPPAVVVQRALAQGNQVLVDGWLPGWPSAWGVARGIRDDSIIVSTIWGKSEEIPTDIYSLWTISPGDVVTADTKRCILMDMLKLAARRIRGQNTQDGEVLFGADAYVFLVHRFGQVPFCPNCAPRECGLPAVAPILNGARNIVAWLPTVMSEIPKSARMFVHRVIRRYSMIIQLLEPAFSNGPTGLGVIMGDLARQCEHGRVLEHCKLQTLLAANDIDEALQAWTVGARQAL